ncbi:triple tyrosine motif-containing protein [Flavobacterium sp. 5]|uniref:triple tyrosine motif-containing protein n=1 Tax=Flavobacterium sp. 5 TaxID=2035199 RepID=UPI000CB855E5|nr:triple tyrosine motif-containing protein [Flavobacterium sp. 5]PKB15520.1 YXYXY domain-containing protein [Flavobacterium sp. 5]
MKTKLTSLFFLLSISVFSQCLPPIVNYAPNLYGAGNQNWMISQDKNQFVFFANNEGLLEFNGSYWQLYPSPNETIIRSVKVIGDRIYTGSYMEFGFWKRKADGLLKYHSLSKFVQSKFLDDENFWNILSYDHWVVFQSSHRIYIYDVNKGDFKIISPNGYIFKSFKTANSIYYQPINQGLYEIEAGMIRLVSDNPILKNNLIVNVFAKEDKLLISTQSSGFYELSGNVLTKFPTEIDNEFSEGSVYSCETLSDGGFVVGTVSNGIFILSKEGKLKFHITQRKGLSNNTALSLFEDFDNNLWVGLDNGISCINLKSPIQSFVDNSGVLGTVYTSQLYNDKLYVGTNQGLFYKDFKSDEDFTFVKGTKGQVWSLFVYDGTLFCGHHSGTFVVNNGNAHLIFSKSGTWNFTRVPGHNELLLQGNYYGISVLEKKNNEWSFRNKLNGFEYSSRYLEITNNFEIYVSHEYKGVFRLETNGKLQNIKKYSIYKEPTKGKNAGLVKFNNSIYYAYKGGVFKLNDKTKQFEKDVLLSSVFDKDQYTSGKMIVDSSNRIWLFSKNYINYYSASKLSKQLKQNSIPIPVSLSNSMLGYENIKQLSPSNYFFGATDGFYTMNINDLIFKDYKVLLSSVVTNALNEPSHNNSIHEKGSFKNDENNINFYYTVPEYNKYINAEYQYMLEGFQDRWSEWNVKSSVNFKNLPAGDYVFKVRAKYANSNLDNTVVYTFTIQKPWYGTTLAIIVYFVLGLILIKLMHEQYVSYYHKKEIKLIEENNLLLEIKELENEHQMMRLKNEQLSQDVDAINKELAASAMNLNSKNELLAYIHEDLKNTNESDNKSVKSVISTINRNISGKDSWSVFQEAFDKTDKDFLKKMKEAHSSLTPNDLRLCAYLRLNLSSKEMAPLLNISVRSVEIKRYRLRKKMDLTHEQGLVEYILAV